MITDRPIFDSKGNVSMIVGVASDSRPFKEQIQAFIGSCSSSMHVSTSLGPVSTASPGAAAAAAAFHSVASAPPGAAAASPLGAAASTPDGFPSPATPLESIPSPTAAEDKAGDKAEHWQLAQGLKPLQLNVTTAPLRPIRVPESATIFATGNGTGGAPSRVARVASRLSAAPLRSPSHTSTTPLRLPALAYTDEADMTVPLAGLVGRGSGALGFQGGGDDGGETAAMAFDFPKGETAVPFDFSAEGGPGGGEAALPFEFDAEAEAAHAEEQHPWQIPFASTVLSLAGRVAQSIGQRRVVQGGRSPKASRLSPEGDRLSRHNSGSGSSCSSSTTAGAAAAGAGGWGGGGSDSASRVHGTGGPAAAAATACHAHMEDLILADTPKCAGGMGGADGMGGASGMGGAGGMAGMGDMGMGDVSMGGQEQRDRLFDPPLRRLLERQQGDVSMREGEEEQRNALAQWQGLAQGIGDGQGSGGAGRELRVEREQGNRERQERERFWEDGVARWEIRWEDIQLGQEVGHGACGTVYHGTWNGSDVAVKVFARHDISGDFMRDFKKEIRIMEKLRHPNILLFMGAVASLDHLAIVTEFLPRGSLFRLLHRRTAGLTRLRLLRMALDVARGVNYLHKCSPPVVHHDLKSANLLVDRNWTVKVGDFGLRKMKFATYLSARSGRGTVRFTFFPFFPPHVSWKAF
ncbi:unnamed protein product [Closterium sp. Naga37s-1]|nr:unnamed protein product [Closterium sp. Naga37s-1]